jgi:hypothetical protein
VSLGLFVATNLLAATSQRRYAIKPGDSPVRNLPSLAPFPDLPAPTPSTPHGIELVSYTREGWIWDRETLEKGPQPT